MTQFEKDKKYYSADRMKIYVSIKETQSESLKIVYRTNTCIFHKNSNQAKNVDTWHDHVENMRHLYMYS